MLKRLFKLYIIFIFVLSLVFIYYLCNYVSEIHEIELIDEYINETKNDILVKEDNNKTIKATKTTTKKSNYLMVLEIPKINLKKGIYDKSNKLNNVDKNVTILSSSDLPDKEKGSVILASHNGNTKVSYFKNLEQLSNNDLVYIYYLGNKYTYKIYKSEVVDKIGEIRITKNGTVSNIVLISCKNGTKDKQIVYLGSLISINTY